MGFLSVAVAGFACAGPALCLAAETVGGEGVVLQGFLGVDGFAQQLQEADGGDAELGAEDRGEVSVHVPGVAAVEVEQLLEGGALDDLRAGAAARLEEDLSGAGVVVVRSGCGARHDAAAHAMTADRVRSVIGGFDWNTFVATLLATLAGAGVAAGTSFWLAERERPKPMWHVKASGPWSYINGSGQCRVEATIINVGDGTAYHPHVTISGTDVAHVSPGSEAVLAPGEQITVGFTVGMVEDQEGRILVAWPKNLTAVIEWRQPPRRRRTQRLRTPVEHD